MKIEELTMDNDRYRPEARDYGVRPTYGHQTEMDDSPIYNDGRIPYPPKDYNTYGDYGDKIDALYSNNKIPAIKPNPPYDKRDNYGPPVPRFDRNHDYTDHAGTPFDDRYPENRPSPPPAYNGNNHTPDYRPHEGGLNRYPDETLKPHIRHPDDTQYPPGYHSYDPHDRYGVPHDWPYEPHDPWQQERYNSEPHFWKVEKKRKHKRKHRRNFSNYENSDFTHHNIDNKFGGNPYGPAPAVPYDTHPGQYEPYPGPPIRYNGNMQWGDTPYPYGYKEGRGCTKGRVGISILVTVLVLGFILAVSLTTYFTVTKVSDSASTTVTTAIP